MAQPLHSFPPDPKTSPGSRPPSNLNTQLAPPPSYGLQPQLTGPQQPLMQTGMPSQQARFGSIPPVPMPPGTMPQQFVPMGPMSPQQVPLGTPPLQPMYTNGALPTQQVPMGAPMMGQPQVPFTLQSQAQLGQQFQSAQFAQCAVGNHARSTKYGIAGIIGAIVFFPIGLLCMLADKEDVCLRCGQRLG